MSEKTPVFVCNCELENGYIFKNFFTFNNVRGRPIVTFLPEHILASNRTADNQLYAKSYIHGDEVNLSWNPAIPLAQRQVSLTFDSIGVQAIISRIKKKDQARIYVCQLRNVHDKDNFMGQNSSDEFIIYFSCGAGGDGREGVRSAPASRVSHDNTLIKYPVKEQSSSMVIPVKAFKQMIDSFTKCKKETVKICYYTNRDTQYTRPGINIITEVNGVKGEIFEKFGDVPEDNNPTTQMSGPKIDPSSVVSLQDSVQTPNLQIVIQSPNEFSFAADKIPVFAKLASMHTEGNVRIEYQEGCHLKIAHRFGAFGECEICLHNSFVN